MRTSLLLVVFLTPACHGPSTPPNDTSTPNDVSSGRDAASDAETSPDASTSTAGWLASGGLASCASLEGRVWCWGSLPWADWATPMEIPELAGAQQLSLGALHACALFPSGEVMCGGSSRSGRLGMDTPIAPALFVRVVGVHDAVDLSVGDAAACVVQRGGQVLCWGDNAIGQTGRAFPAHAPGLPVPQPTPAPVEGLSGAVSVGAAGNHACALLSGGSVACWGHDAFGALGRGARYTGGSEFMPQPVEGLSEVTQLAITGQGGCAMRVDGSIWCWGGSVSHYPGFEAMVADNCPVVVDQSCWRAPRALVGVAGATELQMSAGSGCTKTAGQWQCWGRDDYGQTLGDGRPLGSLAQVSLGAGHLCVRAADGAVSCRGAGERGQLGDGLSMNSRTFVRPALPTR